LHILETDRLILRRWTADDEAPCHAICSDPLVMQYVADGACWSLERTRQFIEEAMATERQYGYCRWPMILKADGLLAGFCGFTPAEGGAEMGWRLASRYWGRGLATEAARAVLAYGFSRFGFRRVIATVQSANGPSRRVAEKLGMTLERTIQRNGREVLVFAATSPGSPRQGTADVQWPG